MHGVLQSPKRQGFQPTVVGIVADCSLDFQPLVLDIVGFQQSQLLNGTGTVGTNHGDHLAGFDAGLEIGFQSQFLGVQTSGDQMVVKEEDLHLTFKLGNANPRIAFHQVFDVSVVHFSRRHVRVRKINPLREDFNESAAVGLGGDDDVVLPPFHCRFGCRQVALQLLGLSDLFLGPLPGACCCECVILMLFISFI